MAKKKHNTTAQPPEDLQRTNFQIIKRIILDVYHHPADLTLYTNLRTEVGIWDDKCDDKRTREVQGHRIFEDLQSLAAYLRKRKLTRFSEFISEILLFNFPDKFFPKLPRLENEAPIDMELFQKAQVELRNEGAPEETLESLREFEEFFHKIMGDLASFTETFDARVFYTGKNGNTSELHRLFIDLAERLLNTGSQDLPWRMMNHLAVQMNNRYNNFLAAFTLLRAVDDVKIARPTATTRNEIMRNHEFFLRNFYRQCIDEALMANDYEKMLKYIDKFLPMADMGYEKTKLTQVREKAMTRVGHSSSNIFFVAVVSFVLGIIFLLVFAPSTDEWVKSVLGGSHEAKKRVETDPEQLQLSEKTEVTSRTALPEKKPPFIPHQRKLELEEIRHVLFQRRRLDYLHEQKLTQNERRELQCLQDDWIRRCEFYEYEPEEYEKVYWDMQTHLPHIIQDAQDILADWRGEENFLNEVRSILDSGDLLSLTNPAHISLILGRLRQFGYYRFAELPSTWTDQARRALREFKGYNLGVMDDEWDTKTQEALFCQ